VAVSAEHIGDGLRLGPERQEVDPVTGKLVVVQDVLWAIPRRSMAVTTRRQPVEAFACWRLESMALLALYGVKSVPALVVLSHALRAKTLGHGPIRMTYAFAQEVGATESKLRTLLRELEGLQADLGWVRVIREPGKAVAVEVTNLGLQQMAPPRSKAPSRTPPR
jgi:hypothetical protein